MTVQNDVWKHHKAKAQHRTPDLGDRRELLSNGNRRLRALSGFFAVRGAEQTYSCTPRRLTTVSISVQLRMLWKAIRSILSVIISVSD